CEIGRRQIIFLLAESFLLPGASIVPRCFFDALFECTAVPFYRIDDMYHLRPVSILHPGMDFVVIDIVLVKTGTRHDTHASARRPYVYKCRTGEYLMERFTLSLCHVLAEIFRFY